jgi:guanylate kinase
MHKDKIIDIFSIVVSAPSGTGKTTIIKRLMKKKKNFVFAVSTTTRVKRSGEREGRNYYFLDEENFKHKIQGDEFLEWAIVHENYYGTTKKEVDRIRSSGKIPIFDVDIQGAKQLRGKLSNAIFVFIIPPSIAELRNRLNKRRADSKEQIEIRIRNAISELKEYRVYDYIVINEKIERAVEDFESILMAERCRSARNSLRIKKILEDHIDNPIEKTGGL